MEKAEKLLRLLKSYGDSQFTGSVTLNFHRGNLAEKVEVKTAQGLEPMTERGT